MIDEIRRRRVPQTLIGYAVGLWGGAQVIDFVEQRYALSPHWLELFVVAYLLILPTVIAITWNKGAAGHQKWSRATLATAVANVIVAVTVLSVGFSEREFGTVTETIVVENEEGEAVERKKAKSEFRRTITLSFPLTDALDGDERWRAVDLQNLLEVDLAQNSFLELRPAWFENARAQRAGLPDATRMPRPLVHEAARNHGSDAFLVGRLDVRENQTVVDMSLLRTADGTPIAETTLQNADVFALADELSAWVRESLELPTAGLEDHAVRDLTTTSTEALRANSEGMVAFLLESNPGLAAERFERAIEIDPTYAMAHMAAYGVYVTEGRMAEALPAIDAAMKNAYRLSERSEFLVRASYYGARSDVDKTLGVLEMWARLYPGDPAAYRLLAQNYRFTGRIDDAIAAQRTLLELLPADASALEQMIEIARTKGDLETAVDAARRWCAILPDEVAPLLGLAVVQRDSGELEAARETVERALLLDPTHMRARLDRAAYDRSAGDFERAEATYREILESDAVPSDRFSAIDGLMTLNTRRGRIDEAIELFAQWEEVSVEVLPGAQRLVRLALELPIHTLDGRPEIARERLVALKAQLPEPFSGFIEVGVALNALWEEDADAAHTAIDALAETARVTGVRLIDKQVALMRTHAHVLAGDFQAALAVSDSFLAIDPSDRSVARFRAAAQRELGDAATALETIDWQLEIDPSHPRALVERGQILAVLGRPSEAVETYDRALEVWAVADPDHVPSATARARADELRRGL